MFKFIIIILLILSIIFGFNTIIATPEIKPIQKSVNNQSHIVHIHIATDTLIRTERELLINHLNNSLIRPKRIDEWDCVDYSFNVFEHNPEWKLLTISRTQNFCPKSHMVNYQFIDNTTLIIYDGLINNIYTISNYQWDCQDYYHFWLENEQPVRYYRRLYDNRNIIYIGDI